MNMIPKSRSKIYEFFKSDMIDFFDSKYIQDRFKGKTEKEISEFLRFTF